MKNTMNKLQLLIRAEMAVAQFKIRAIAGQAVFIGAALVFLSMAFAALNFSFYQFLAETKTPALAALIVGVVNLVLTIGLIMFASGFGKNNQHEISARQIRDAAYNNLSSDLDGAVSQVQEVKGNVQQIGRNVKKMSNQSVGVVAPAAALLLGRKAKGARKAAAVADKKSTGPAKRTTRSRRKAADTKKDEGSVS